MAGIATSTCPSGSPASLVTLPVIVTGACAASRAGSARNALTMMGTTRLRVSCMSPPTVSVTPTTDDARVDASAQTPTYTTPVVKTRAHDDGGDSGRRAVDRDVKSRQAAHGLHTPISPI